jgi:DNA-directed RNA polymerase subunit N (RpoN/RPB10)
MSSQNRCYRCSKDLSEHLYDYKKSDNDLEMLDRMDLKVCCRIRVLSNRDHISQMFFRYPHKNLIYTQPTYVYEGGNNVKTPEALRDEILQKNLPNHDYATPEIIVVPNKKNKEVIVKIPR